MGWAIGKVLIASVVISVSSSLAAKRPALAGFLVALPLSSLLALALGYVEVGDTARAAAFARSIFWAVPLTLTFFVPFLFAERLKLPFWGLYALGLVLLTASYFLHRRLFA